jgi:hypothetical protein
MIVPPVDDRASSQVGQTRAIPQLTRLFGFLEPDSQTLVYVSTVASGVVTRRGERDRSRHPSADGALTDRATQQIRHGPKTDPPPGDAGGRQNSSPAASLLPCRLRRRCARLGPDGVDHSRLAHGQLTNGLRVPEEDELAVRRPASLGRLCRCLL